MQHGQVQCMEYGEEMALGLLVGHIQTQNGKESDGRRHWVATSPVGKPRTYRMDFLTVGGGVELPR